MQFVATVYQKTAELSAKLAASGMYTTWHVRKNKGQWLKHSDFQPVKQSLETSAAAASMHHAADAAPKTTNLSPGEPIMLANSYHVAPNSRYTILADSKGQFSIVAVDEKGAHFIMRPETLFFPYEICTIWKEITGETITENDLQNLVKTATKHKESRQNWPISPLSMKYRLYIYQFNP